jgi:hypothetical protein
VANEDHVALLKQGVDAWNAWRAADPSVPPDLRGANLTGADLTGANLIKANLSEAHIGTAFLVEANFSDARLSVADLSAANLSGASLTGADLLAATLVGTDLTGADITGCRVHGVSAWRLKLDSRTKQQNLIITHNDEPEITVDNIEVAQFVYLLLHNPKIRDAIDTIGRNAYSSLGVSRRSAKQSSTRYARNCASATTCPSYWTSTSQPVRT